MTHPFDANKPQLMTDQGRVQVRVSSERTERKCGIMGYFFKPEKQKSQKQVGKRFPQRRQQGQRPKGEKIGFG